MRKVSPAVCRAGDVLADSVVNDRGVVVVRAGVALTDALIRRLREMGVWHVFIDDPRYAGIEIVEPLSPHTLYPLAAYLRRLVADVRASGDGRGLRISATELMSWVDKVSDEVAEVRSPFVLYQPNGDELTRWIGRTINTAVLGARTLRRIGGISQARNVVAAALLQDLGVWSLEPELRHRLYTERDQEGIRQHLEVSQRIATSIPGLSSLAKAIVNQHHERWDGSGLPQGRREEEIHPLARVMAVVDDYLSLVYDRAEPVLPHEAVEQLMAGVGYEYDHAPVKAFCAVAPVYPVGTEIALNTGQRAVVVGGSGVASRPVVRLLTDATGEPIPRKEIDLSKQPTLMIVKVLQD